ncbi:MAG: GNAT family N-acetyltransferase [Rhodanobacteraceae bacterium]
MLSVRPYRSEDAVAWDVAVAGSRNGNFLHRRDYLEYHANRFDDRSLVIEKGGEIVAVFPAEIRNGRVTSHGGLTYAGLISTRALRTESILEVFDRIGEHYRSLGTQSITYKPVPHVFHALPADEDLYALHRLGARLKRRDLSSVIALREPLQFTAERRRSIAKARKKEITLRCGTDAADFHGLLSSVLRKHGTTPTHSLAELSLLRRGFPGQIVLHEARSGEKLLAGALVYDFGRVVHTQYLAVSDRGRQLDALSLLLSDLVEHVYVNRCYFSFGISTEQDGRVLNKGLIAQKERFGARAVVHDCYEWDL